MEEDPSRNGALRTTTQTESAEIERTLSMVFSLLRAVQGGFGLSVDTMHQHLAPRQPSANAVEALTSARIATSGKVHSAASVDFHASMRGSALFVPAISTRVLSGVCGGDIVASIGEYYIVAPTGDARDTAVYVPDTSPDCDGPIQAGMSSAQYVPSSASARKRHDDSLGELPVRFGSLDNWRTACPAQDGSEGGLGDPESLPSWSHYAPVGHMLVARDLLNVASTTGKASNTTGETAFDSFQKGINGKCPACSYSYLPSPDSTYSYSADVAFVPCENPSSDDRLFGAEQSFKRSNPALGFGDGQRVSSVAQPPMPTVFRLKHTWGRMPQESSSQLPASRPELTAEDSGMSMVVPNTVSWGEWQELAPALAHPVGWEVAGTLPDANPPVALFRPVPPEGFAALGVVAVPYSPDAHAGRLVRQPSQVMATEATSAGAAVAAQAAAKRRATAGLQLPSPAAVQPAPPGGFQPQGGAGGQYTAAGTGQGDSGGSLRLPPPPALDSVWCVHVSVIEIDERLLLTGVHTDGHTVQPGPAESPEDRAVPQLVALSTVGRTFDVRSAQSLSKPASAGHGMGPLYRMHHQPMARPMQHLPQPLRPVLTDVMERAVKTFFVRHDWLVSSGAPLPG